MRPLSLFLLPLALIAAPLHAELVVTDIGGKPQAGLVRLHLLTVLPEQALLLLPEQAHLTLVDLHAGQEYALRGPARYRIVKSTPQRLSGAPPTVRTIPREAARALHLTPDRVEQASLVMRGPTKSLPPAALSPDQTALLDDRPSLHWPDVAGADHYHLELYDAVGAPRLSIDTPATQHALSDSERLDFGQRYDWQVTAKRGAQVIATLRAHFSILPEADARRLAQLAPAASAPVAEHTTYILRLMQSGAAQAARDTWHALAGSQDEPFPLRGTQR